MTKKAERAAEVLENRKNAYVKKVRGMLGHVSLRLPTSSVLAAFEAGTTAEAFATSVAVTEPVGACIMPMKLDALDLTEKRTRERVAKLLAKLEEHGGNINAAYPFSYSDYTDSGKAARSLNSQVRIITQDTDEVLSVGEWNTKNYKRVPSEEGIARYVQQMRDMSAMQYDEFICKMVGKVGEVEDARIEGNHVWGDSTLTVTKKGTLLIERWHTQMILNFSKYGLAFNQFPSRKLK